LETLVGQVLLDEVLKEVPLTKQELFYCLVGVTDDPMPEDFQGFVTQWCQQRGVTLEYFNKVVLREFQVQKFKQLHFADHVESEFLRTKSDLDQVEYSRIRLNDLSLAQELYFQLRDDGVEFAQLAQQYSLGNERQTGGRVGPISLSSLPNEIATLFCTEQVGTIYGPVPVGDTFWIVRLEQFIAARLNDSTRTGLINSMYARWLHSQVKNVLSTPGMFAVQSNEVEQLGGNE
jgi:parvulin-like peptidyl-prolyl isomerase